MRRSKDVNELIDRMQALFLPLEERGDPGRYFLATYQRTTRAVQAELAAGGFLDPAWVERWDLAFADFYLEALETVEAGRRPSEPWAVAFGAAARDGFPPLRHVLLGMNAHINYDLAQSLLAVITDEELDDPELVARRAADHRHIDEVLAARVGSEDAELEALSGARSRTDRLLAPLNRLGTRRFLKESREKVWANTRLLSLARRAGPAPYAERLAELERLAAARVADLVAPGQVVLKLAVKGFGVRLPDTPGPPSG
ncbi:MAG TPA: DUF5995 family protein [Actinomycetota bacterium]|nr:DUF5995 family protein [Actinomycetota bacterium]